jgi:hypothetical protein
MKELMVIKSNFNFRANSAELGKANNIAYRDILILIIVLVLMDFNATSAFAAVGLGSIAVCSLLGIGCHNNPNGLKVTTPASANIVTKSVYVGNIDSSTTNRNFQLVIYMNSGSVPGTLAASSATGTLVANSLNTVPISISLQSNASYWLIYNTSGGIDSINNMYYNKRSDGLGVYSICSVNFGIWPTNFPAASLLSGIYSLEATFGS